MALKNLGRKLLVYLTASDSLAVTLTSIVEMKKTYLAALERREAMLLSLVDRQVEVKQDILAEMRLEVAAARARVLAAREEG